MTISPLTSEIRWADTPCPGRVVLQDEDAAGNAVWLLFERPERILRVQRVEEVLPALREAEAAVDRGWFAAGFLSYEASPAFDKALVTHRDCPLPLLWLGLYKRPERLPALPPTATDGFSVSPWIPHLSRDDYRRAIARIKDYIASGDTYQVNYTLRLRSEFAGSPWALFHALCRAQRSRTCAYVDTGDHVLCSGSPELFFQLSDEKITCRPMKGTAPRGLTLREDEERSNWLGASAKNRAENVMIVDMVRNDLGRIARPGTVRAPELFAVERYETLFQMTSTVTAATSAPVSEVFTALFPCASITGAPKVRTLQIIKELESAPRGVYTGCIGFFAPGRRARFNIAIRTVHLDRESSRAEYGTGGGIVWDSTPEGEYEECLTKALLLTAESPAFRLLETLLWRPGKGYYLLRRHLDRICGSARYFGFPADRLRLAERLAEAARHFPQARQRVRLLIDAEGEVVVEAAQLMKSKKRRWQVALARQPVDRTDRFFYHKTTKRILYENARAECPGCDDVILWNENGEITESTIANVVIRRGGEWVTPPVSCGLLAGTYREHLLARGRIREAVITVEELRQTDALFLINSVRGWIPAELVEEGAAG